MTTTSVGDGIVVTFEIFELYYWLELYKLYYQLEMWANAQRDGRPAEYRWRPLFNAAKFG